MTAEETRSRIVRALQRGPMYEGALLLVVGQEGFYRALRALQDKGIIERTPDSPMTWRMK